MKQEKFVLQFEIVNKDESTTKRSEEFENIEIAKATVLEYRKIPCCRNITLTSIIEEEKQKERNIAEIFSNFFDFLFKEILGFLVFAGVEGLFYLLFLVFGPEGLTFFIVVWSFIAVVYLAYAISFIVKAFKKNKYSYQTVQEMERKEISVPETPVSE